MLLAPDSNPVLSAVSPATSPASNKEPTYKYAWQKLVNPYRIDQLPSSASSVWQLVSTLALLAVAWGAAYRLLDVHYGWSLALSPIIGGLFVRIFIFMHDCGHGSFFKSRKWNDAIGIFCSIFVLTPYYEWTRAHAIHHANAGKLDDRTDGNARGVGDVYTMTVAEYRAADWKKRLIYRLYRSPLILFIFGPPVVFGILHRIPSSISGREPNRRSTINAHLTTLAVIAMWAAFGMWLGFDKFLAIQVPSFMIAALAGIWLFYVQHQYEHAYWEKPANWDYSEASLKGCSYYKLPKVVQYFTGNIGFHHIHHLAPKIPNYQLEACYRNNPEFQEVETIGVWDSFKTIKLRLWDEEQRRMVSWREAGF